MQPGRGFYTLLKALLFRVSKRFQGELALSLLRTFMTRGIAAMGALLFVVVLGRLYGPTGVGVFALAQSIYLGAGIIAKYGMDNALMRYVGQEPYSANVKVYLRWALIRPLWLSLMAAVVIYTLRVPLEHIFSSTNLASVLPGIAVATPAFTLAFVLGGFMKGVNKPATACLLENGSISLVASFILLGITLIWPNGSIAQISWAFAIAAWLVLGQGAWQVWRWIDRHSLQAKGEPITQLEFHASSQAFLVLSLAQFMQQVLGIMVAAWLLTNDDLGLFRSAERMAGLITFILFVISAIFPPRFARLFYQKNLQGLSQLARQGALLGIVLASPLLLICLFLPSWVLGVVGEEFVEAAPMLQIIAGAQLVNVATGSVGYLLNMTGYERLMRNIALVCNSLGLVLFFLLIPIFDALGAALALSAALVSQNLTALFFVWRRLGIWMLPIPNFLKLIGILSQKEAG